MLAVMLAVVLVVGGPTLEDICIPMASKQPRRLHVREYENVKI